ncbi:membrane protein [Bombiscardovia apis]|uniref:Membrane protein n=1 Tax=Bombiscardovia apis TaxID=2932182 RepID=A0ABM8BEQ8_9BIFI|nr:YhgE/Pip domain-containing protein [Bombiscardovia apis]BDR55374.1 membrane protein [Bombiscardovia apis]
MRNVLTIFKRDVMRLLRVPAAWIIVFGLIFIPPLYAWFNVLGFWDPYGNTTNIHVAIVNEDKGADNELMGKVNLGSQIVTQLKGNHQLGWQFVDRDEAMNQVESGRSYAAIVIPGDFSEQLTGVVTDRNARPQLEYFVNEKANAIATKVTDTGASTVDKQVNNTFVSTASKVVSSAVNSTGDELNAAGQKASDEAISDLLAVRSNLAQVRSSIRQVNDKLNQIPSQTQEARQALKRAQTVQMNASQGLNSASGLLGQTQSGLNDFVNSSSNNLDQASNLLSQASGQANISLSQVTGGLTVANSSVGAIIDKAQNANDTNARLIADLEKLQLPGSTDVIAQLKKQNDNLGQSITNLQQLNTDTGQTISKTASLADTLNGTAQGTLATSSAARQNITSGALPELNKGLNTLSGAASALGAGLGTQGTLASQANATLDQLDQTAAATVKSLSTTDSYLGSLEGKLTTLSTDMSALGSSNALAKYFGSDGKLDVAKVADFMLSPTVLDTKVVYPVSSYGSGMAPLFVNLSLWVGAFMLMVIVKLEVDDEDLDNPTPGERYWGRWLLLAPMAAAQGLVTTVGSVLIGVQTASIPLFILTAMVTSLVYLSIMYALSTTFMHVGKALCIVLVILQIPGGSGLYPIEMMPTFFRKLYPFFPFTYSINAFRETIGGFYGNDWWKDMGKLLIFAFIFFILGLFGRPRLNNLNRLFAREIAASDMIVTEPVQQICHEFTLSQALAVLANKEEYRQEMVARATRFAKLYPKLKRGALIAAIIVPAILALTFSFTSGTMLVALATWIIWILAIIAFLMTIEMMRDSVVRQIRLGTLSDQAIRGMVYNYDKPRRKRANLETTAKPRQQQTQSDLEDTLTIPAPPQPEASATTAEGKSEVEGGEQA